MAISLDMRLPLPIRVDQASGRWAGLAETTVADTDTMPTAWKRATTEGLVIGLKEAYVTEVESDALPPGLDADTVRAISRRKREPEFLLKWRLAAFERWSAMTHPAWGQLRIEPIVEPRHQLRDRVEMEFRPRGLFDDSVRGRPLNRGEAIADMASRAHEPAAQPAQRLPWHVSKAMASKPAALPK